jgi:hypothetical protein
MEDDTKPTTDELSPVTLVVARYPPPEGAWLAFPCQPWDVPREITADENVAYAWYEHAGLWIFGGIYGGPQAFPPIGIGKTAQNAYINVLTKFASRPPIRSNDPAHDGSYRSEYEVTWPGGLRTTADVYHRRGLSPT